MRYYIVFVLLLFTSNCLAEKINVGDEQIDFPEIAGYSKVNQNTKQFSFTESSDVGSNRLLYIYAPPEIAKKINNGELINLDNYILCKSSRPSEFTKISKSDWRNSSSIIVKSINNQLETLDYAKESKKITDNIKKQLDMEFKLDFGVPKIIKKAEMKNDVITFTTVTRMKIENEIPSDIDLISKGVMTILKGKLLQFFIYRDLNTEDDILKTDHLAKLLIDEFNKVN